ncbi:MAG: hypothetical protein KKD17_06745 [Nanoarchaeota archaeon]|nr:hypothetical protein [Nanoarchaeota archaeon]
MHLAMLLNRKWIAMFQIFFILFGIYITIQILIKVFGGSWSAEDLVISLLMFNLGGFFTMAFFLARLVSDFNHHRSQFRDLAKDFKRTDRNVERILTKLG